ncbi:hypothetical protein HYY75_10555, partial [bacterium]|nr:hypothetical protein [bacterium]
MEKRILMTEPKVLRRKSAREKPPKIEAQRGFQSKISHRQRSEAIGLIMVGISAFWFSLLYYLSKSKVANGVNWVTVQFGIGIFILPLLIGIMGIQRFLERPFTNTFLRVIGTTGTLVFGLGLLRFEGGKFGSAIFNFVSSNFGEIPSRLLLIFLTLSALIFALDILYKDLLIGCLNLAQFLAKFGSFLWESFLTFLALFLGAAKNTGVFATGIGAFALSFFKPGEPSEEEAEIHLLPFFKKKESSPSALPDQVSQVSSAGGERILTNEANLSPRHWREQPKDESKNSDDNLPCVDSPPSASMEIPPICSQQIIVNVESVSSLVSMTPTEEILVSPKTFSETSQAIPSSSSSS